MGTDVVTGATVEVAVEMDGTAAQIWELISDVGRVGAWSPECVDAWWVDLEPPLPRVGARFQGHNRYPGGFEATTDCVVTTVRPPSEFTWVVLDPEALVERPGSVWSYRLAPAAGRTKVTQRFVHGPGMTGLRSAADKEPGHAPQVVQARLSALRRNMLTTLTAMARERTGV